MACRSRNADLVRILAVGRVSSRARRDRRWNWSQTHSTPWCTARIGARTRYVARTLPTRRSTPGSGRRSSRLTAMWKTPPGLVFAVVNVSVDVAPASGEGGENDAVTPAGRPLALSSTGWSATPRLAVNETVVVVLAPVTTVADDGLRCSERVDG